MPDTPQHASGDTTSDEPHGDEGGDDTTSDQDEQSDHGSNGLEWAVFALGVAITLSVIGYLGVQIATGSDEPAHLVVSLQPPETRAGTVFIPLEVKNEGERVAEEAVIEVCAGADSCGEVTFRYVPKGSTRSGVVGLDAPLMERPTSRVVAYRTI